MKDIRKLVDRKDAEERYTWNLKDIFERVEDFFQCMEETKKESIRFIENYRNKLDDAETIIRAIKDYAKLQESFSLLSHYTELDVEADGLNPEKQKRAMKCTQKLNQMETALNFFTAEIAQKDHDVLENVQNDAFCKHFVSEILRMKPHRQSDDVEKALASLKPTFDAFYNIYNTAKIQDMVFDDYKAKGSLHPLSYNIFENMTESDPDTETRRHSFEVFHRKLEDYKNVTAQAYLSHCQTEKRIADIRGYDSVIDYLLDLQNVSRELYNRQLDVIMEELAPHMRRYADILKREYALDRMTIADMKLDIDPSFSKDLTVEEGMAQVKKGLSVLGEDYRKMLDRAFSERWIDFVNTKGKSTGAFCASPFGVHSYVLLTWSGKMSEAMVLAHELGHAGHSYYSGRRNNILDDDCSMYFVEAPSTANELIMSSFLLQQAESEREKRWINGQIIARTYYHNFVTHFLEGYFQREVYRWIDRYDSFTADDLCAMYRKTIEQFFGNSVEYTKGIELTWMRQPHYYMGLYPYTYSAGLTIGTQVAKSILSEGQPAVDRWLKTLEKGGSEDVISLAKTAGVDITTDKPLRDTIRYIGEVIDQLDQ